MKVLLTVPAIRCEGCVATVQDALKGLPGLERVTVTLSNKRLEAEGSFSTELLLETLERVGFHAEIKGTSLR